MQINNGKYVRAVITCLIIILITIELPYSDKSIIQYIIPVISVRQNGIVKSKIFLSGLIPLIGFLWSYNEIVKSNIFKASKSKIFIIMFVIVIPILFNYADVIKYPVYYLNSGVKSIEIKDSKLVLTQEDDKNLLKFELKLKSYRSNIDGFQVAIILPEEANKCLEETYMVLNDEIRLGCNQELTIVETLQLKYKEGYDEDLLYSIIYEEDYKVELSESKKRVVVLMNDSY